MITPHPERPHQAVIFVEARVYEKDRHGNCLRPVYEIGRFPVGIDATDRDTAIRRLNEILEELKKCQ